MSLRPTRADYHLGHQNASMPLLAHVEGNEVTLSKFRQHVDESDPHKSHGEMHTITLDLAEQEDLAWLLQRCADELHADVQGMERNNQ